MCGWLPFSGLPAKFHEAGPRGRAAYILLHRIMDLDAGRNTTPGRVEIPFAELAELCALSIPEQRQAVALLRRLRLIKAFVPDGDDEAAVFQVCTPLPVPAGREQIIAAWRGLCPAATEPGEVYLRYIDPPRVGQARMVPDTNFASNMALLVDHYFSQCGFRMNAFILDHLNRVAAEFTADEINDAFSRARKNEVRNFAEIHGWMRRAKAARKNRY